MSAGKIVAMVGAILGVSAFLSLFCDCGIKVGL
jgi:hypothetical protein